jgi:two-component system, NtrC family, sensor kinase
LGSRRILIVENDAAERERTLKTLAEAGYEAAATSVLSEVEPANLGKTGVVVVNEDSFGSNGVGAYLDDLAAHETSTPCLVVVQHATVEHAVELMRRGAFTILTAPIEREQLVLQVEQALRHHELCRKNVRLQQSLELHERLAMIGKLAAGVAHELNNPLDGVLRFVNLAMESLPADASEQPFLLESRRGLRRMADIVRELLQFSRNATVETADEDALSISRDAVGQVIALAEHKRVETTFDFPAQPLRVPRALFQVIGNLAKNAVDAMPTGGHVAVIARVEDERLRISFRDDGPGIPPEIRERIFEPFFTTKEVGKGTGLGLPICQRILERLGGTLELESEIGVGTTVTIDLPMLAAAPTTNASPTMRRIASLARGAGE